jgi:hypothetical protein
MKSDHRHDLKTNELADWILHFPEWASENRTSLIATGVVVLVVLFLYFLVFYRRDVASVRNQMRLTNLVTQVPQQLNNIARAASQNADQSYVLMPIAQDLLDFAEKSSDNDMAALALIQRGAALRAELHYRLTEAGRDDLTRQIGLAQASYQQALDRNPSSPTLAAAANYGLGLCQEDLGNFDKAGEIYREVAQKPEYAGTTGQAAAAYRLQVMSDYKTELVFQPAPPKPVPPAVPQIQIKPGDAKASAPTIQIKPGDTKTPAVVPAPKDANVAPAVPGGTTKASEAPAPVPQAPVSVPASTPAPAGSPSKSDTNAPKGG